MSLKVKICGLKTPEAIETAISAGADMIGLVFFAKSPRYLSLIEAARLADRARGRIEIVALTVDADDAALEDIVVSVRPDVLQLQGSEMVERVAQIRARFGTPTMRAIGIREAGDVAEMRRFLAVSDRIMADAKPPAGATRPGGNGLTFDWRIVADLDPPIPFVLSGGLHPGNVAEAIRRVRPAGVDVSSGVESAPGVKDLAKIRAFVGAAREASLEYATP